MPPESRHARYLDSPMSAAPSTAALRLLDRDGVLDYAEAFLDSAEADQVFGILRDTLDWHEDLIRIGSRVITAPRRVVWHGDPGAVYRYSGTVHEPLPWTPVLLTLRARVESLCGQAFNSVLGNLYRDGGDAMGWHADNERELGPAPCIASLSLGAERRFEIRHNRTREALGMPLAHGSLLLMHGPFQAHWKHRIPRQPGLAAPRINLTFRTIYPAGNGAENPAHRLA